MDFPISINDLPWLWGLVFGVIAIIVIYEMKLKPTYQLPLANEVDLGIGKIWLQKLGKLRVGRITTARNTFAGWLGQALAGNISEDERKFAVEYRELVMGNHYYLAMREGRDKILLDFDVNPLDERFSYLEGNEGTQIRSIGPVQDCGSVGAYDSFQWIWVKLDKTSNPYSPDMALLRQTGTEILKFWRQAATNLSKLKVLEERNKALEEKSEKDNALIAQKSAELDRALDVMKQQLLSQGPEGLKVPSATMQKMKEWFTAWQLLTGLLAYFLSPWIIGAMAPTASAPETTYLSIFIAIIGFFAIPLFRKTFGRWIKI